MHILDGSGIIVKLEGPVLGINLGRFIVTDGDFAPCKSDALFPLWEDLLTSRLIKLRAKAQSESKDGLLFCLAVHKLWHAYSKVTG